MAEAISIVIKQNPVLLWERFHWTLAAARRDFSDYEDDDRSMGGYWSASFKVRARKNQLFNFFQNGLGRHVEVYGHGLQCLHEGMIQEMVLTLPPDVRTLSLDNMINKLWMRSDYDADNLVERSTVLENAASQARFGVKERAISGGQLDSLDVADQATQNFIDWRGWPQASIDKGAAVGDISLEIFSKGYIHTLGWISYNQTAVGGTQGLSAEWVDVMTSSQFVDSLSYDANATLVTKELDADQKKIDIGFNLSKLADSSGNRFIMYMTKGRKLHLKYAAPATVSS